jgi:hypothetical protein
MEHCGKQRAFTRAIRKSKNEEELSKLRSTLEAAFNQLTVCWSICKSVPPLSRGHRQLESHIRIERVLYDLVTANNDLLAATSTFLTDTETGALVLYAGDTVESSHSTAKQHSNFSSPYSLRDMTHAIPQLAVS